MGQLANAEALQKTVFRGIRLSGQEQLLSETVPGGFHRELIPLLLGRTARPATARRLAGMRRFVVERRPSETTAHARYFPELGRHFAWGPRATQSATGLVQRPEA